MYKETEKVRVREEVFSNAIRLLSIDRRYTTITERAYPRKVRNFLVKDDYCAECAYILSNQAIKKWQKYYKSLLGRKKASELKVAFLSGPNPENDVEVMIKNGILTENIWAFENENKTYNQAVSNLKKLYPDIKLFQFSIDSFFRLTPIKFDIIYLDCCSPIFTKTKEKSIQTLYKLFEKHALSSPGILITNYSLPSEKGDTQRREELALLASIWLFPKRCLYDGKKMFYPSEEPLEFDKFFEMVRNNFDFWYGEFITRFIMDLASVIVPLSVFNDKDYSDKFFRFKKDRNEINKKLFNDALEDILENESIEISDEAAFENDFGGWVWSDTDEFQIPWSIGVLTNKNGMRDYIFPESLTGEKKSKFGELCDALVSQLSGLDKLNNICDIFYVLFAVHDARFYSETVTEIMKEGYWKKALDTCDVFTAHTLMGALLGQLAVPYHVNVKQTLRWTYKAKQTQMYTDMLVLDECRYIYDMVPTMDMILNTVDDLERQLLFRFVLDSLDKNLFYYNQEWFEGSAMIGIDEKGFEARELRPRINLTKEEK